MDDYLTLRELSERLGVRQGTLRMWRHRGTGPASLKVGVAVVYRVKDVEAWEREQAEQAS